MLPLPEEPRLGEAVPIGQDLKRPDAGIERAAGIEAPQRRVWIRRKQLRESLEDKIPAWQTHLRETLKKTVAPYVQKYDVEGKGSSSLS